METVETIIKLAEQKFKMDKDFAAAIGTTASRISEWKSGKSKSYMKMLPKIAEVLGVSQAELLGEAAPVQDDELAEYLDELRMRPEMRMLFHTTKGATKEQIEAIVHMIEGFEKK